ncbi:VCBS repeat-containing protein [Opitutaceae bacterium EW11]|nr:VCBS repeat-containing protein [Opitutaceae bacterium EW11]
MRDSSCQSSFRRILPLAAALTLIAVLISAAGCNPPPPRRAARGAARSAAAPAQPVQMLDYLHPEHIGAPIGKMPWIAHLIAVDLDQDGLLDVVACEGQENKVVWIRQVSRGKYEEQVLPCDVKAPVHVEAADMDGDGDLDLLISCMGVVFPNNDQIGTVTILENLGGGRWAQHDVLEHTSRVTDIRAGDLNGDGKIDLAVGQFGYDQGEIRWLERTGPWEFKPHVLLELSGDINVGIADFDGDHRPDIVAQISQQWEEIYLFQNRGGGEFERKRIWSSSNEDYGSSGMVVVDLNRDGKPDVLFSNGDGFGPAVVPGPRPYHGVQWLENRGQGNFYYHRIGDMYGAYNPVAIDLDQDGNLDVVVVSAFIEKDSQGNPLPSLAWFRNDGRLGFEKRILAYRPQDQLTLAAGDFDGNGKPCLVTGGFYVFNPAEYMGRVTLWRR